jgi:protein TonB
MTYTSQTSLKTRMASLGAVALLHVGAAVVLVSGLAAYRVIVPEPHTEAVNMPLAPLPQPEVKPSQKPDSKTALAPETMITLPLNPIPQISVDPLPQSINIIPTATPEPRAAEPARPQGRPKAAIPRTRPGEWANEDDYPAMDLRMNHEGMVRFQLAIGVDGRVSSCTVTQSSGWPGLDSATCALVTKRARFTPAQDESGQPMAGSYSNAIRWVIPR